MSTDVAILLKNRLPTSSFKLMTSGCVNFELCLRVYFVLFCHKNQLRARTLRAYVSILCCQEARAYFQPTQNIPEYAAECSRVM